MACSLLRFLLLGILLVSFPAAHADSNSARTALEQGRLDDAATELRSHLDENPHDAVAHLLLCRVFYAEEFADRAIAECEAAVADTHADGLLASDSSMWLGRAYGLKASHANPILAFRLAKKVVASFEQAVALNPKNVSAYSDLGEYYVGAPSIVGGGLDKAENLATRVMTISATKAHRLLAMIAEKRNDYTIAEAEYKKAFEAQRTPQTLVDLADFYQRRKQCDQAVSTIKTLIHMDRTHDAALVDAASVLTACNREPKLAFELLSSYLASPARSDNAPAPRVHVQLGYLLAKSGDTTGAKREYDAALQMATGYEAASKAAGTIR